MYIQEIVSCDDIASKCEAKCFVHSVAVLSLIFSYDLDFRGEFGKGLKALHFHSLPWLPQSMPIRNSLRQEMNWLELFQYAPLWQEILNIHIWRTEQGPTSQYQERLFEYVIFIIKIYKTVVTASYLFNGDSYTGKTASLN